MTLEGRQRQVAIALPVGLRSFCSDCWKPTGKNRRPGGEMKVVQACCASALVVFRRLAGRYSLAWLLAISFRHPVLPAIVVCVILFQGSDLLLLLFLVKLSRTQTGEQTSELESESTMIANAKSVRSRLLAVVVLEL